MINKLRAEILELNDEINKLIESLALTMTTLKFKKEELAQLEQSYSSVKIEMPNFEKEVLTHPARENCDDEECHICGYRDCPEKEPFHYHHDGCPAEIALEMEKSK